jgi:hypothetical protein
VVFPGVPILVDTGQYTYNPGAWRDYINSTRAHNSVEVDSKNYCNTKRCIYGSALKKWGESSKGVYFVDAEVSHKVLGVTQKRLLLLKPREWLVVVDWLRGKAAHRYTQWFHFNPKLSVSKIAGGAFYTKAGGKTLYIGNLNAIGGSSLIKGKTRPRIQGWTSYSFNTKKANYALGLTSKTTKSAVMGALFSFMGKVNSAGSSAKKVGANMLITLKMGSQTVRLKYNISKGVLTHL